MLMECIFTYMDPTYVCAAYCKYLLVDAVTGLHMGILVLSRWLQAFTYFEGSDSGLPQDSEDINWGMSHNSRDIHGITLEHLNEVRLL